MLFAKSQKGSTTVEAALLVPVIFLSIIAVIFVGLLLSERCSMQAAADYASSAGKADAAVSYKYSGMAVQPENTELVSDTDNHFINKKLRVSLRQNYAVPVPGFMSIFGLKSGLGMKVVSEAVISKPEDLIRNIDLAVDIKKDLTESR